MEGNRLPRRQKSRLRLAIKAHFIALGGQQSVKLQDLSQTGAKILLGTAEPIKEGFLRWMQFETFGEVVWQRGPWVGLRFDRPLDEEVLLETRAAAPGLIKDQAKEIEHYAQEFVQGGPDPR